MVSRGKEKRRLSFPELKKERLLLNRAKVKENRCLVCNLRRLL
jgi:hypothetical protein